MYFQIQTPITRDTMSNPLNIQFREPTNPFQLPAYIIHLKEAYKKEHSVFIESLLYRHLVLLAAWIYDRQHFERSLKLWQEALVLADRPEKKIPCLIAR